MGRGPEELEKYRTDLGEWVQENEEDMSCTNKEKRKCENYGIDKKTISLNWPGLTQRLTYTKP